MLHNLASCKSYCFHLEGKFCNTMEQWAGISRGSGKIFGSTSEEFVFDTHSANVKALQKHHQVKVYAEKTMKFLLILLLLIPAITASDEQKFEEPHEEDKGGKVIKKDQVLSKIVKVITEFVMDAFKHLTSVTSHSKDSPAENVLVSPLSLNSVISMLLLGSRAMTHHEIQEALNSIANIAKKWRSTSYSNLHQMLSEQKGDFQLQIGNAIFLEHTLPLQKNFQDEAQNHYHANIRKVNFSHPKEAEKEINEYMKNKTEGKMKELVKDLPEDAKMVLINYIQFKGKWENSFDEKNTKEGEFRVNKDETVKVPFLRRIGYYNMAVLDEATLIGVPYNGNVTALFIRPNEGKMDDVQANMKDIMKKWTESQRRELVDLSIPRFSVSGSCDLKEVFPNLGIADGFSDSAYLSAITGDPNLIISKVLHTAEIKVDEKRAEAAVTAVLEEIPRERSTHFNASHPFSAFNKVSRLRFPL
ncbi:alpha-1-antitrypsin-like [Mantella aurantiaca]